MVVRITSPDLVGRSEAVEAILGARASATRGEPRHNLVVGEAGVGKTRLLTHTGNLARDDGTRTLLGNCVAIGDAGLPFAPFVQILQSLIAEEGAPQVAALAGRTAADLARLVPTLGRNDASVGQPMWAESRLHQALFHLLCRLAERSPLVVQLEDMHWADAGSLGATLFILRSLRSDPISMVMTVRADVVSRRHSLRAWLADIARDADVERIDLEPLDLAETAALVHNISDTDFRSSEIDEIHRRSGGNPFFVESLLATQTDLSDSLPSELRDILLSRVDVLTEPARSLIGAASVGGQEIEHDRLLDVTSEPEGAVESWLGELVGAALLIPVKHPTGGDAYSFRHALLQEAIYEALLPAKRRRLHLAWAETLASHGKAPLSGASRLVRIAYHWREAGDARALDASVRAGDAAMESYSFGTAAREYEAAVLLWPPSHERAAEIDHVELLQRLAQASYYSKHDRKAITAYREAIAEIPVDDVARRTDIQGRLARSLWASGEWAAATEAYEEALRIAPDEPADTRTRALAGLAQTYMANGQYARSKPLCDEAVKRARATGNRQLEGHVLNALGMDLAWLGEPDAGQGPLDAALEIALELEHPDDVGRAYVNHLETLVLSGRMDEALASATEGIKTVERMGTVLSYGPYIHVAATYAAFQAGRWNLAV